MSSNGPPVVVSNYQPNGEWELLEHNGKVEYVQYDTGAGTDEFPFVYFTFKLKRKPVYHIINILLPCIIISFIAGLQFLLPPSSGEKISLGISVLLSFSVLLLLLSDIMPKTSDVIPLVGKKQNYLPAAIEYAVVSKCLSKCLSALSSCLSVCLCVLATAKFGYKLIL